MFYTKNQMDDFLGLGALGKAKKVKPPKVAVQCKGKAAAEKKARAACTAQNLPLQITSCKPFNYTCGWGTPTPQPNISNCPTGSTLTQTAPGVWSCVATPTPVVCPSGYQQSVTGQCLPTGTPCPTGYSMNTAGQCLPSAQVCPAGYTMSSNGQCVPSVQTCPAGYLMNAYGQCQPTTQPCPAGTVAASNGQCVNPLAQQCSYGYAMNVYGQCVPQAQACPSGYSMSTSGQCVPGVSYPSQYPTQYPAQYSPYLPYQYNQPYTYQQMPYSPYTEPLLTPIDQGSGADQSEIQDVLPPEAYAAYPTEPSAYMPGYSYGGAEPLLTPISEGTQWGAQPAAAPASSACQQEQGAPATSDAYGPLQTVQVVCPSANAATGGYPSMTQVESEAFGMEGLKNIGRYIG